MKKVIYGIIRILMVLAVVYCSTTKKTTDEFPNPFSPHPALTYFLNKEQNVRIILYDIKWKTLDTLINKTQQIGKYYLKINRPEIESGEYFIKYEMEDTTFITNYKLKKY